MAQPQWSNLWFCCCWCSSKRWLSEIKPQASESSHFQSRFKSHQLNYVSSTALPNLAITFEHHFTLFLVDFALTRIRQAEGIAHERLSSPSLIPKNFGPISVGKECMMFLNFMAPTRCGTPRPGRGACSIKLFSFSSHVRFSDDKIVKLAFCCR